MAESQSSSEPALKPLSTSSQLPDIRYNHLARPNTGNVPPIAEWERRIVGKTLIKEEAEGDETTFKRSDLPKPHKMLSWINDCMGKKDRLNVEIDLKTYVATRVYYG